ncbi:hypothetical protein HMPREF0972_00408 [Actinomyces sp. oral taxon 848 str. F0332]|nr:hypothetical protein HMPREF0972_00408 [Actinomyces sp. oral taxon 848 str. F0332]
MPIKSSRGSNPAELRLLCKEPQLELQFDKHIRFIVFTLVSFLD